MHQVAFSTFQKPGFYPSKTPRSARIAASPLPKLNRGPMTEALQRGSVVLYGGRYGVVWLVDGAELVLHPVEKPRRATHVHDVERADKASGIDSVAKPSARTACAWPSSTKPRRRSSSSSAV